MHSPTWFITVQYLKNSSKRMLKRKSSKLSYTIVEQNICFNCIEHCSANRLCCSKRKPNCLKGSDTHSLAIFTKVYRIYYIEKSTNQATDSGVDFNFYLILNFNKMKMLQFTNFIFRIPFQLEKFQLGSCLL